MMNAQQSNIEPSKLDVLRFPLSGVRLIEASAGTGKTYTISGLVLRLILGHGDDETCHATPLTVDQILVVTFTEAATAELRDRIRRRIRETRIAFTRGVSSDPMLANLLGATHDHSLARYLLLQAERQMDEAAIFTIHGFCQRMLKQNAFESGSSFENEFITDESALKKQVVADFWRFHFYPLNTELATYIRSCWSSPEALYSHIQGYLSNDTLELAQSYPKFDLTEQINKIRPLLQKIQQLWGSVGAEMTQLIAESDLNKSSFRATSVATWVAEITAWQMSEDGLLNFPESLAKFDQSFINSKLKKNGKPFEQPLFELIEQLFTHDLDFSTPLKWQAITECRKRLATEKAHHQLLSFDDLLSQLNQALLKDHTEQLASKIRKQYPVAMIDEFQDTDAQQYSIFQQIYLNAPDCGWFMIGDPKQAIYGFRGADIFTYIKARNEVSAHYTLETNWRSSDDMIQAVNRLFEFAKQPFIYSDDIPFYSVNSSPVAKQRYWSLDDVRQPAMRYWYLQPEETVVNTTNYRQQMAHSTAEQIYQILNQGAQLYHHQGSEKVRPNNIAVLVRGGKEAILVKQALAERGIASVYLSNKESVFNSVLAQDVLRFLLAILESNERNIKSAVASELFDYSLIGLYQLSYDEKHWESLVSQFAHYREIWRTQGVLPMLRQLIQQQGIALRWAQRQGERQLTDFLHLSELLQERSQDFESDHALVRWFSQQIEASMEGGTQEGQKQRLESERNLVQIVTLHKSKGLEYDLVFLPFVMDFKPSRDAKFYDSESAKTILDLKDEHRQEADRERLAEDVRLLYVGITRAIYGCFVGIAPLVKGNKTKSSDAHKGAMGYLLQRGEQGAHELLYCSLQEFSQSLSEQQQLCSPPLLASDGQLDDSAEQQTLMQAATLETSIPRQWRVTSYSGLMAQSRASHFSSTLHEDIEMNIANVDIEAAFDSLESETKLTEKNMFNFPRGTRAGTFLHTLFEEIEFTEPVTSSKNQLIIKRLMEKERIDPDWLIVLQNMVERVLKTPLDNQDLYLDKKNAQHKLVEMEFVLPIALLSAPKLNQIQTRYDSISAQATQLEFYPVQGMLKGFIDLVFEHQGKYYVLDWKSNHLGDHIEDYYPQALEKVILDHRYDVQYQLYALALHRFLKSRIIDYDYDTHFGGVYYLFLRGMDGSSNQTGIFFNKPDFALIDELEQHISQSVSEVSG